MIPARAKASGKLKTPPPQTVATRLSMAMKGEDLRREELCVGLSNSSDV